MAWESTYLEQHVVDLGASQSRHRPYHIYTRKRYVHKVRIVVHYTGQLQLAESIQTCQLWPFFDPYRIFSSIQSIHNGLLIQRVCHLQTVELHRCHFSIGVFYDLILIGKQMNHFSTAKRSGGDRFPS